MACAYKDIWHSQSYQGEEIMRHKTMAEISCALFYIDGFVFEKLLGKRNLLNLDQIFEYDQVISNDI